MIKNKISSFNFTLTAAKIHSLNCDLGLDKFIFVYFWILHDFVFYVCIFEYSITFKCMARIFDYFVYLSTVQVICVAWFTSEYLYIKFTTNYTYIHRSHSFASWIHIWYTLWIFVAASVGIILINLHFMIHHKNKIQSMLAVLLKHTHETSYSDSKMVNYEIKIKITIWHKWHYLLEYY